MNKHLYADEIRLKIGYNNYESILAAAREHKFDGNQVTNFTKMLGRKVGRGHMRRMEKGHASDKLEMRRILSDYYHETMHSMTSEDAIETLAIYVEDYLKVPNLLTAVNYSGTGQLQISEQRETSENPDLRRFMDLCPLMQRLQQEASGKHNQGAPQKNTEVSPKEAKDLHAPRQRHFAPDSLSQLEAGLVPSQVSSSPSIISIPIDGHQRFSR